MFGASKVPLKDYQKEVARHMQNHDELLVVHQTGAGKTLSAVTSSQCYLDKNPNGKVLIVSPVSVVGNFRKEMEKYGVVNDDRYVTVSYDIFTRYYCPRKRISRFDNYSGKTIDGVFKDPFKRTPLTKENIEESERRFPTKNFMLIIDESHNVRNYDTVRAIKLLYKAHEADKRLLLTATPYVNRLSDLGAITNVLMGDNIFPKKILAITDPKNKNKLTLNDLSFYLKDRVDVFETSQDANYPEKKKHLKIFI